MNISEARKIGIAEGELIQKRTEVEVQVLRAGVGQFGTPSNISVVAPQANGPYSK